MRERILDLDLKGAIEAFQGIKWKFFSEVEEAKTVRVEVPRGSDEVYVVELTIQGESERKKVVDELLGAGFVRQSKRMTAEW